MIFRRTRWFEKPKYRFDSGDATGLDEAGTLVLPFRREHLLRYLPARAKVAEIGVAKGKFSKSIVAATEPAYLALIDAWEEQSAAVYAEDGNNASAAEQASRHGGVTRRFARERGKHRCDVIRAYSDVASAQFPDAMFDWVYIDANHSYDACLADLRIWAPKVNAGGFLCGHDFAHHANATGRFGVVEAVFAFLVETGFHLIAITVEHFPTFVIAKNRASVEAKHFFELLLSYEPHLVSVPQDAIRNFGHARILESHARRAALMRFF